MTAPLQDAHQDSRTLADQVVERLQDDIVLGVLPPGTKLGEAELAARYGVSRGPLREAIRRLESRKLLERIPHVGTRVATLKLEDLIEIYRVREALEGMAARQAAENMSQAEIAGLWELLALHEGATLKRKRPSWARSSPPSTARAATPTPASCCTPRSTTTSLVCTDSTPTCSPRRTTPTE